MILAAVSSPQPYRPSSSEPTWCEPRPDSLGHRGDLDGQRNDVGQLLTGQLGDQTRPGHQPGSQCLLVFYASSAPGIWPGSSSRTNQRSRLIAAVRCTAAWGETVGACVGLAYVRAADSSVIDADWVKAGSYQVNVGGQLYPISVSLRPIYDPTSAKIRP